ncbi:MAG: GNAT family N-acetyltransferase [Elusimicrobia bacterium]|nr:GNAT family N-acetyltransferase [Elusimicrobiota bacterium]
MSATAEALRSRKVRLRPFLPADARGLADAVEESLAELRRRFAWASAEQPYDAPAFVRRASRAPRDTAFALVEPRTERLLGAAWLAEAPDGEDGRLRLSLWVRKARAGRGCATEAGRLLVEHAFRKLGAHRLYARIDPANRAGRAVIRKLGFRYEGCLREDKRLNGRWVDQECWGLLKAEWKA